jgi:hypothetical protein
VKSCAGGRIEVSLTRLTKLAPTAIGMLNKPCSSAVRYQEGMLLTSISPAQNELQFVGSLKRIICIKNARSLKGFTL